MARFPSAGDDFGGYRITGQLGRGGMGVVFAAEQRGLGRTVALKVLSPELAEQDDYRERFTREATVLARLDSPHIIAIYDHGEQDGCLYIATQYVAGGDLSQALRQHGPVPTVQAAQIAGQLAWALTDAHTAGVVHRDLKPSNVLLRDISTDVFAYLCDFGIAQDRAPGLTAPGSVAGTFAFLAPERLRGEAATPLADLYALGCVLFTSLTGATPYGGSDVEIAMAHLSAPVPRFTESSPVAAHVNEVLRRSLAKEPGDRYPSAPAMRSALQALVAHAQITPHAPLVSATALLGTTAVRHPSAPSRPYGSQPSPIPPPPGPPRQQSAPSHPSAPLGAPFAPPPSQGPGSPTPRTGRRPGALVAGAVAGVVLVAAGVSVAVATSRGGDEVADPDPTSTATQTATGTNAPPTSEPTIESPPPSLQPTSEPPKTTKPKPKPFYPDVAAAPGVRISLGKAALRTPVGWGTIDTGVLENGGVGARDYSDYEGYYSSVFVRRSKPVFPLDSIALLDLVAKTAVQSLDDANDDISLIQSDRLAPAWLGGSRAARVRAAYHNTGDDLDVAEESWFVMHGKYLYRITFQHSRIDPLPDRRAQIDPMVVSFRWSN